MGHKVFLDSALGSALTLLGLVGLCALLVVILGGQCVVLLALVPLSFFGLV